MISPQPDCWLVVAASTWPVREAVPSPFAPLRVRNDKASGDAEKTLAFLMKRRKTVSVTPAMGASTVAGAIWTLPMVKLAGTRACSGIACSTGASHFFCSSVYRFFIGVRSDAKAKGLRDHQGPSELCSLGDKRRPSQVLV